MKLFKLSICVLALLFCTDSYGWKIKKKGGKKASNGDVTYDKVVQDDYFQTLKCKNSGNETCAVQTFGVTHQGDPNIWSDADIVQLNYGHNHVSEHFIEVLGQMNGIYSWTVNIDGLVTYFHAVWLTTLDVDGEEVYDIDITKSY